MYAKIATIRAKTEIRFVIIIENSIRKRKKRRRGAEVKCLVARQQKIAF